MKKTTCAACDCELGPDAISVKLGGKSVEVCCEECAQALKEADTAATAATAAGKN
jgi:RNase P subunit RPR2